MTTPLSIPCEEMKAEDFFEICTFSCGNSVASAKTGSEIAGRYWPMDCSACGGT